VLTGNNAAQCIRVSGILSIILVETLATSESSRAGSKSRFSPFCCSPLSSASQKGKHEFRSSVSPYQFNCVFLFTDRNVGKEKNNKIGAGHETLCNYPHATRFPQIRLFVVQESSQVKKETKKEKMGEQVCAF